jgi:hypothetical protein
MAVTVPTRRTPRELVEVAPTHRANGHELGPRRVIVGMGAHPDGRPAADLDVPGLRRDHLGPSDKHASNERPALGRWGGPLGRRLLVRAGMPEHGSPGNGGNGILSPDTPRGHRRPDRRCKFDQALWKGAPGRIARRADWLLPGSATGYTGHSAFLCATEPSLAMHCQARLPVGARRAGTCPNPTSGGNARRGRTPGGRWSGPASCGHRPLI